jgi:ornithine cyclodeaminase/alanine dehydrogenase-like protein (mu-crystallin family)
MTSPAPELRYLAAADVEAAMPPIDERLELAERTMAALAEPGRAELPAKIGVHPRPQGSFAHAMPAHLRGAAADDDGLGMKWIAGFGGNAALGLPSLHGIVLINDPATGVPIGILDGGPITAERTAAVSGVAIRRYAPPVSGRPVRVAVIGAGIQARSHLAVIGRLLPGADVRIVHRSPGRDAALAEQARTVAGVGSATGTTDAGEALADADVVVTVASFTTPDRRQAVTPDLLTADALVVAVDYATMISADVARSAALFLVDHLDQFLANRDAGQFDRYPDPHAMLGEAILAGTPRPQGRVLVTHLGVGLADVVFGSAILRRAVAAGLGTVLPR